MVQNYITQMRRPRFHSKNGKTKKGRPNGQPFLFKEVDYLLGASLSEGSKDDQEVTNSC